MTPEEITSLSCAKLARAIRARQLTALAAMQAVLARAGEVQQTLNCFVRIDGEEALAAARLADAELARGVVRGPLHGVPMAHKDMYYREGVISSCGSRIKRDMPAPSTATALKRLDAAGAIQFGVGWHQFRRHGERVVKVGERAGFCRRRGDESLTSGIPLGCRF